MLLRVALSVTAFIEGTNFIGGGINFSVCNLIVELLYLLCAIAILIGFLTPAFSVIFCLTAIFSTLLTVDSTSKKLLGNDLETAFTVAVAISQALLGPGIFSLDAHLFGRREIIIPDASPPKV